VLCDPYGVGACLGGRRKPCSSLREDDLASAGLRVELADGDDVVDLLDEVVALELEPAAFVRASRRS